MVPDDPTLRRANALQSRILPTNANKLLPAHRQHNPLRVDNPTTGRRNKGRCNGRRAKRYQKNVLFDLGIWDSQLQTCLPCDATQASCQLI